MPRIILEIVSLLRYLLSANLTAFIAQLAALFWILFHPFYIVGRIIRVNKIKKITLFSIVKKLYKPSIVFDYFILGKKKYSDLIN
tara:strand:+ start:69 stop:323 length:255 start_codon:yes stop_codon:yes gene_type:complete